MNRKMLFINFLILIAMALIVDPAYCGIQDAQIKAASKTFIGTMKDWMPAIIGGGLVGSGICLFANNFKKGIKLVTGLKSNMKDKLMNFNEKFLLRKRSLIESVFSVLKRNGLEHSRHRSIYGFILHILGSLIAYQA